MTYPIEAIARKMCELTGIDPDAEEETSNGTVWLSWQVCMGDFLIALDAAKSLGYALVPTQPTTKQKRDVWGSDELPVFDWTAAKLFWKKMIEAEQVGLP